MMYFGVNVIIKDEIKRGRQKDRQTERKKKEIRER